MVKDVRRCSAWPAFVGSTPAEVKIFKWIMSPLYKKTNVAAAD